MKILLNKCYGGFGFSDAFLETLGWKELGEGSVSYYRPPPEWLEKYPGNTYFLNDEMRTNPEVIALFEKRGSEWSSSPLAELELVDVPEGMDYIIDNYDGMETLREDVRTW